MAIWDSDLDWEHSGWGPWRDMQNMRRRLENLMEQVLGTRTYANFPPVNVWADDEKAIVTAEIPGVKMADIDLSVENRILTIGGSREPEKLQEGEYFRRHERGHGAFSRTVELPFEIEAQKAEAHYANGILRITMPRSETSKPRKVQIKT